MRHPFFRRLNRFQRIARRNHYSATDYLWLKQYVGSAEWESFWNHELPPPPLRSLRQRVTDPWLSWYKYCRESVLGSPRKSLFFSASDLAELTKVYDLLADEASRRKLIEVTAYRNLGAGHVLLPRAQRTVWEAMEKRLAPCRRPENLWDFTSLGFPICLRSEENYYSDSLFCQYVYREGKTLIGPSRGDYVVDGGGYIGDTALFFSDCVGPTGRVFSFEFIPPLLERMRENLDRNPELSERIMVVENPLWNKSGEMLAFQEEGAGSRLLCDVSNEKKSLVRTVAIDDWVAEQNIRRIDFLKLDIEGAEPEALLGAKKTLERFRPKVAVCLYHRREQYYTIPQMLAEILPDYHFYFDHQSHNAWETILFAAPKEKTP